MNKIRYLNKIALYLAIYMSVFTICGAFISCHKKKVCVTGRMAEVKTCAAAPCQGQMNSCQLKKTLTAAMTSFRVQSSKKIDPPKTVHPAAVLLNECYEISQQLRWILNHNNFSIPSPPLILLKKSFLC
jgi:hypothetical protein